jgi:hypothetical protein
MEITMFVRLSFFSVILSLMISAQAFAQAPSSCSGRYSTTFTLSGAVENPRSFNYQELAEFTPQTSDPVSNSGLLPIASFGQGDYTGALLWELVTQAGLVNSSSVKNDADRKYVVVTGSNCKQAVFSLGELDPSVGGGPHQVIVAFERDGRPLSPLQGFAEIVAPGDRTYARWISNITDIKVVEVVGPTPE